MPDPSRSAPRISIAGPWPGASRRGFALFGLLLAVAFTGQTSVLSVHGHALDAGGPGAEFLDERRGDELPATGVQGEPCLSCEIARRVQAEQVHDLPLEFAGRADPACAAPQTLAARAPNAVERSSASPRAPPVERPISV